MIVLKGNGFNYMINGFIRNNSLEITEKSSLSRGELDVLCDEISDITSLWKEFNEFFDELAKSYPDLSHEHLIKMINVVLDFLRNSDDIKSMLPICEGAIEQLKCCFDGVVLEKIIAICDKFRKFEGDRNHTTVRKAFSGFGTELRDILKEKSNEILYVTTNYDGVGDVVLGDGSLIPDGFGIDRSRSKDFVLVDEHLNFSEMLVHIHGSYKFQKNHFETVRLRGTAINQNPSMIFNQPELKERQIIQDNVLREYYRMFKTKLITSKDLIIIGNSLANEPHFIKCIDKYFNEEGKVVHIYDAEPEVVAKRLEDEMSVEFEIKCINTSELNSPSDFVESIKTTLEIE